MKATSCLAVKTTSCLATFFILAGAARAATPGACSDSGRKLVMSRNTFSKPAHGNLDETDASLPIAERIKRIDDAGLHADQCRAVLGPLPRINCQDGYVLPVTVNGVPYTYEHGIVYRDGVATDLKRIKDCDTPSLSLFLFRKAILTGKRPIPPEADPTEGCHPNVRFGAIKNGPVDWVYICHYKSGIHEPAGDPFDFVTVVGSNALTGETCFFAHDFAKTDGMKLPVPGGTPGDPASRAAAAKFWDKPAHNTCLNCHANNKAWVLAPHLNQSRLGGDGTMEIVPETPKAKRLKPGWGYRVVGVVHNYTFPRPKAIVPLRDDGTPDQTCVKCHVISDSEDSLRIARDSVGLGDLEKYAKIDKPFYHNRKAWMPPDRDGDPHVKLKDAQAAVKNYERAVFDPKFRAKEEEILARCPAPKALDAKSVSVARPGKDGWAKVAWSYRNDYGQVALRDDVRFEVTVEGSDGSSCNFPDVAPAALGSDKWAFSHPSQAGVRYTYRLRPYRYCFDREDYQSAAATEVAPRAASAAGGPRGRKRSPAQG